VQPVKYTAGSNFQGVVNVAGNAAGNGVVKVFAKNYALHETKSFKVRISQVQDLTGASQVTEYQWKLDEHDAYSAPATFAASDGANALDDANSCTKTHPCELVNNGDNTVKTGIYIYHESNAAALNGLGEGNTFAFTYDHQEGRAYEYGNAGNAHQEIECSGRGECDRGSGVCACFDGYTGLTCGEQTILI
jgi:hypothetical protein